MEIQLSEKQNQLITAGIKEQQDIQQKAQAEFNRVQKHLDELVTLILDGKGLTEVEGVRFEGGKLFVPEQVDGAVPFEEVKE